MSVLARGDCVRSSGDKVFASLDNLQCTAVFRAEKRNFHFSDPKEEDTHRNTKSVHRTAQPRQNDTNTHDAIDLISNVYVARASGRCT